MRRIFIGLAATVALFLVARWAWLALVPETTLIRWRLEGMSAGFNETRLSPCLEGIADDWRHTDARLDRAQLADMLRSIFFHEKEPETGRFPFQCEIEPESLEIELDADDGARARAQFVGVFSVLEEGEWETAWRARIELEFGKHEEHGWQVTRSAHEDLEADGRFLGMR